MLAYRDDPNAWAPSVANGTTEWLALGYATPVYATAVRVRESYGNGAVTKIELREQGTGTWHAVWSGVDATAPGAVADLEVALSPTSYLADGVRVTLDMNHSSAWEELDAVGLYGSSPATVGDRVWLDEDGDGIQDTGEPGVAGITVQLLDGSGNPTGLSTTTDGGGHYSFTVAAGTYRLEFAAPSGMAWTRADAGSDETLDSDVDPATGRTGAFTVVAGQTDTSWDGGLVATIAQWASSVLGYSSQYAVSPAPWSSARALGAPDVTVYRDDPNAWAPSVANGTTEWIALGYTTPVCATGVRVRESYGNGAVTKIELREQGTGTWHEVWSGVDATAPGAVADLEVALSPTSYLADGVRVTLDMNRSSAWEELDAVALEGVVPATASQWASSVLGYSSQYAASPAPWSSARALGAPDVTVYRDDPNAWAPSVANGTTEWLALGYTTPVYATGVRVRESYGNGAVTKIELRDHATGTWQSVWSGVDATAPGAVADLAVTVSATSYLVDGVRITLDMNHSSAWEEIDAVALEGPSAISGLLESHTGVSLGTTLLDRLALAADPRSVMETEVVIPGGQESAATRVTVRPLGKLRQHGGSNGSWLPLCCRGDRSFTHG